jgi:carboxyl-terminal processing protease
VTRSDDLLLDDLELVFGRLEPGQSRTWEVPICVPAGLPARTDPVTVEFSDMAGHQLTAAQARVEVVGRSRPAFSYGVQVIDNRGNGDGRLQHGEHAKIRLVIRNEGPGATEEAEVRLRNKAGDSVIVSSCRHVFGRMEPGTQQVVEAEIDVDQAYQEASVPLELQITDAEMRESTVESIDIPMAEPAPAPAPDTSGAVTTVASPGLLREAAAPNAGVVARAAPGSSFRVTARSGDFARLDLGGGRTAWVAESDLRPAARGARPAPAVTEELSNRPPRITLRSAVPADVRGQTLHLEGEVSDPDRVLDMYIFVGRRKPFYLSNRRGNDPHRLAFSADLPLEGGSNSILIVARETSELVSRQQLIVRRDNPDGSPIETRDRSGQNEGDELEE